MFAEKYLIMDYDKFPFDLSQQTPENFNVVLHQLKTHYKGVMDNLRIERTGQVILNGSDLHREFDLIFYHFQYYHDVVTDALLKDLPIIKDKLLEVKDENWNEVKGFRNSCVVELLSQNLP